MQNVLKVVLGLIPTPHKMHFLCHDSLRDTKCIKSFNEIGWVGNILDVELAAGILFIHTWARDLCASHPLEEFIPHEPLE